MTYRWKGYDVIYVMEWSMLVLSQMWMDSRRVNDNLKGTDGCFMASRACDHSFERSWDEY